MTSLVTAAAGADAPGAQPEPRLVSSRLIYFSSASGNTHRFVGKLGLDAERIPLHPNDRALRATEPFVLILPTYGGTGGAGSVPKQVIRFLNDPQNRSLIRGVISAGNTNFGDNYCAAGDVVAVKCKVPHLYRFELMGTADDVARVTEGLDAFWTRLSQNPR